MPTNRNHTFSIASVHLLADGSTVTKPLFTTNSQPAFARACLLVMHQQANTAKPHSGASVARSITLKAIANPPVAYQAKAAGIIKEIPKLRTSWPSVSACAEALGVTVSTLSQALYRARKQNGGTDAPAVIHGLCFDYAESAAVSI